MPRDDEGKCRFGWHPRILAFFITSAVGLSSMSSLDCKFLSVDLGWVPKNYYNDELGFGLWTYAAPGGRCLTYEESRLSGGFSNGDDVYSTLFMNNDTNWSVARILALVGVVFGAISLVSAWINVCKTEPRLVDIIAYSTITACMCESAKFGLFLGTDMCTSESYWLNTQSDELSASKDCQIDRGAFMSITSIAAYFVSMVLAVGYATRPKLDDYTYDEASLPSWMASETGSSAKAQVPARRQPSDFGADRHSSVGGQEWSHSAPSTIPSRATPIEDYGMDSQEQSMTPMCESMQGSMGDSARESMRETIPAHPPTKGETRRYDDMSTLTWDPGY